MDPLLEDEYLQPRRKREPEAHASSGSSGSQKRAPRAAPFDPFALDDVFGGPPDKPEPAAPEREEVAQRSEPPSHSEAWDPFADSAPTRMEKPAARSGRGPVILDDADPFGSADPSLDTAALAQREPKPKRRPRPEPRPRSRSNVAPEPPASVGPSTKKLDAEVRRRNRSEVDDGPVGPPEGWTAASDIKVKVRAPSPEEGDDFLESLRLQRATSGEYQAKRMRRSDGFISQPTSDDDVAEEKSDYFDSGAIDNAFQENIARRYGVTAQRMREKISQREIAQKSYPSSAPRLMLGAGFLVLLAVGSLVGYRAWQGRVQSEAAAALLQEQERLERQSRPHRAPADLTATEATQAEAETLPPLPPPDTLEGKLKRGIGFGLPIYAPGPGEER